MRHGAVLYRGRRVLAVSWNRSRVHDQWVTDRGRDDCSIHAEAGLINLPPFVGAGKFTGANVIVVRVRKDGQLGESRPCDTCWNTLHTAGIKRVWHS